MRHPSVLIDRWRNLRRAGLPGMHRVAAEAHQLLAGAPEDPPDLSDLWATLGGGCLGNRLAGCYTWVQMEALPAFLSGCIGL